ncbi:MAG: hypothetical protein Q9169_000524 [Polycauliona sp. 2 TL-2023]
MASDDLQRHFSSQSDITDARLIPHRRIGYVGYKTPEAAIKAVKYHNKSFINMSRITVDLARSVDQEHALKPQNHAQLNHHTINPAPKAFAAQESTSSLKRKRDDQSTLEAHPRFQEFLEVMKPASKSKTWANENDDIREFRTRSKDNGVHDETEVAAVAQNPNDAEYQEVPQKSKKPRKTTGKQPPSPGKVSPLAVISENTEPEQATESGQPAGEFETSAITDDDWLRSRTSRLLGLVDDEDDVAPEGNHDSEQVSKGEASGHWPKQSSSETANAGVESETHPVQQADAKATPEVQKNDSTKSATDRLFIRNLPYAVTEQEIRHHFEQGGREQVEEVFAKFLKSLSRLFLHLVFDEHPDRDNLSIYAYDVTLESILVDALSFLRPFLITRLALIKYAYNLTDHLQVHIPMDHRSGKGKGFAYVQYSNPEAAARTHHDLDGKPFQGRLLHILASAAKRPSGLDEVAIAKLPLKKQQQIKRKAAAASTTFNWNSLYMNADAVMSSISERLGVPKSELLDPTSADAAVKQAHAETHIIQETKGYFSTNGVDLDAFKRKERGDTAILVKNFSYGTKPDELQTMFEIYGSIRRLLMPPSGTIAIVDFVQADHARSAFGALAYRKFKDSVLFLEKAPKDLVAETTTLAEGNMSNARVRSAKQSTGELLDSTQPQQSINTSTLFVRNLNFSTTSDRMREVFQSLDGFLSARVKTKPDPKNANQTLSMGFGFLEFATKQQAQAALAAMDGHNLDDHELLIRASHKGADAAEERRREDRAKKLAGKNTKVIIKNLPFEASKKDVRSLFGAYGQLRSVRMPRKFDSSTRGFAFAEFVTVREAENAIDALKDTHLLGRRLVLDFAAEDEIDPEQEIAKMQEKAGKQADRVALRRLVGTGRKKFNLEGNDGIE